MDANIICITLLGIVSLYFGFIAYNMYTKPVQSIPFFPWGQETGKTHHIQSKNGDASMVTELLRRRAIQGSGRLQKSKLKETRTLLGSTTGAVETFMLTSICPVPCCSPYDAIFDGGDDTANFCPILDDDGTGIAYDAGNQDTRVCGV